MPSGMRCSEKLCRVCFTDMRHTEEGATDGDLPIRVLYKSSSTWILLIIIIYILHILTALLAMKLCWCLAYMDRHPVALGDGVEITLGILELGYCRCISFHLSISCSEYNNRAMKDGIDVSEHIQAEWLLLKRNSFLGNT